MSSGIVQLIAIGAQDEYIMGEPEISFFTSTFKRHSNFSQSVEKQTIQGDVKANSMSSIRFDRTGDMLGYTYLTIDNNTQAARYQEVGLHFIDKVELLIGGQVHRYTRCYFYRKNSNRYICNKRFKKCNGTHPGISAVPISIHLDSSFVKVHSVLYP